MGPLTKVAAGDAVGRVVARRLSHPGGTTLGLSRGGRVVAVIAVIAEVDPLAAQLVASARGVGHVVIAGATSGLDARLGVDSVVAGGTHLATELRGLQRDGRVVALVSTQGDAALRTADCGIGVLAESQSVPWGAHLLCGPGLAQGLRILDAVAAAPGDLPPGQPDRARRIGRGRAAGARGTGARRHRTGRLLAVNGAAVAGMAIGARGRCAGCPVEPTRSRSSPPTGTRWNAPRCWSPSTRHRRDSPRNTPRPGWRQRPPAAQYDEVGLGKATLDELANPLTPVLAAGAGVSAASGSVTDAVLISGVAAVNALLGGLQRVGATRAMGRLFRASATRVRVLRDDREVETDADQIVPGDIVHYGPGDAVAGDARILEAADLEMDESSLTGESQLVPKAVEPVVAASVADRNNMLYEGTVVGAGRATAVVVATGAETEFGRTAAEASKDQTRPDGAGDRLRRWTKATIPVALGAGAALFGAGVLRGRSARDALGTGVGLAVAAVPGGTATGRHRRQARRRPAPLAEQRPGPQSSHDGDAGPRRRALLRQDRHPHRGTDPASARLGRGRGHAAGLP